MTIKGHEKGQGSQGNRVLIKTLLPVPVIPAKPGIRMVFAFADIAAARRNRFRLRENDGESSGSSWLLAAKKGKTRLPCPGPGVAGQKGGAIILSWLSGRGGGIGRHAVLRGQWACACVGSNPALGTTFRPRNCFPNRNLDIQGDVAKRLRRRSAKPLCGGSNPPVASKRSPQTGSCTSLPPVAQRSDTASDPSVELRRRIARCRAFL